jgi:hypothetical protein
MTKQKHLKSRVRARMAKTGESYATARRHVVSDAPFDASAAGYKLRGGIHPDTAAVTNVLANSGVTGDRSGRPLSEALILGIGGGLGAGYILWQFKGHYPIVTLGFRNLWQYPDKWLEKTCERLGVGVELKHTSGAVTARKNLEDALAAAGPRPLAWVDAQEIGYWHLPAHLSGYDGYPVVIYEDSDGAFLIDDRNSAALSVDDDTMRAARGRVTSYRNRLARLDPPEEITSDRLRRAVVDGVRDQVEHLTSASDSFSLPAWRKWSRMLVDAKNRKGWPNAFAGQVGLFGALLSMYESIESTGYNGGSLRDLYGQFLAEAAAIIGSPEMKPLVGLCRELEQEWASLADAAAPRNHEAFGAARRLIDTLHEQVLEDGDGGRSAAEQTAAELWELRTQMQEEKPFSATELDDLLDELSARIERIYEQEQRFVGGLATALERIER